MNRLVLTPAVVFSLFCTALSSAGVVTFTDIDAFRAAAGPLVEIDFSTLPDGTPSPLDVPGQITPEFNYADFGVTFSSHAPELRILGSAQGGGTLYAVSKSSIRNWIEADFEPPVFAIAFTDEAVFGPFLSIFDGNHDLLAEARSLNGFIGMVSDNPIDFAVIDENSNGVAITSILFQPVPEPVTALLLGATALVVARRQAARRTHGEKAWFRRLRRIDRPFWAGCRR